MARTESEQLVFSVEARIAAMEKQMARAGRVTDRTFTGMENRSKRAAQNMERSMAGAASRVGAVMKSFGGGLVAGVVAGGFFGIAAQAGEFANSMAAIGDEAKRAGVSLKAFQEWKFVAEQNRIGVDQMTDGLKELNLRADEFATTGKGSAADAFARIGLSASEVAERLKNPSELMLEIIGRLGQLDKAAQIRIAEEVFGGSAGERFVELLDQGEAGIRQTMQRANELGAVIDEQMIKKAAEVDRRFKEISTTVGNNLKSAIVSATDSLAQFIDGFRAFENQRASTLDSKLVELGLKRVEIENDILRLREEQSNNASIIAGAENRIIDGTIAQRSEQLAELAKQEAEIISILQNRTAPLTVTDRTWTPPATTPPSSSTGGGSSSRKSSIEDIEQQRKAISDLISELEEELRLVGATDLERETSNLLRQAGAAATADQQARIVSLVSALYAEEEATRKATEAAAELRDIGRDVLGGLVSDLKQGQSAADLLSNALERVADRLLDIGLDGLFGGGGGLGSIFGGGFKTNTTLGAMIGAIPGRANGGPVSKGRPYIVGERRPELFVPNQSGTILPKLPSMPSLPTMPNLAGISSQNNSGNVTVNFSPTIDARGADIEAVARIDQSLAKLKNEFSARVVQAIRQNNRAGVDFY